MSWLTSTLNNREIATLCWLAVAFTWMLSVRDVRRALWQVIVAFCQPAILVSVVALGAYTLGLVQLGRASGIWTDQLAKDTVAWFLGVGLVLLANCGQIGDSDGWLRSEATKALRLSAFVAVFVNLVVLPLPVELFLVPAVVLLGLMATVAGGNAEFAAVRSLVDWLLGLVGAGLLVFVTANVISSPSTVATADTARSVGVPIALTLLCLPFVYLVGVLASYQSAFGFIDLAEAPGARRRALAKAVLAGSCGLRAHEIKAFRLFEARRLVEAGSLAAMRRTVVAFRAGVAEERDAAASL